MDRWIDLIMSGKVTTFGGVGIGIALVLLLTLRLLLPARERRHIRAPLVMLLLHVIVVAIRAIVPEESDVQKWLAVCALFLILAVLGNSVFLLLVDWLLGHRLGRPMPRIFRDIIAVLVYVVVSIITLRAVGVEPGSLLTTSALLTAVIALSLQETLGNLFAGLTLEAQRPFQIGDWIQFDSDPKHVGRVIEINWRATKVLTNDGVEIIVPNGALAKMPIANFTQPTPVSRRTVRVSAPYDVPPKHVQETIVRSLEGLGQVLTKPEPYVLVGEFGESGINYDVLFFIDNFEDRGRIDSLVRSRIWYGFARAGISIPYAVRDVRWRDASKEALAAAQARVADRERDIRQVDFMSVLSDEAVHDLAERTDIRLFSAGEPIIRQGESGNELFVVRSGEVAVVLEREGRETEIARLGPGKFFGEMSLMTGEKRSATVRAAVESEMLVIGHSAFKSILLAFPETAERVSGSLAKRQAQLDERASLPPGAHERAETERQNVLLTRIRSFFKL